MIFSETDSSYDSLWVREERDESMYSAVDTSHRYEVCICDLLLVEILDEGDDVQIPAPFLFSPDTKHSSLAENNARMSFLLLCNRRSDTVAPSIREDTIDENTETVAVQLTIKLRSPEPSDR